MTRFLIGIWLLLGVGIILLFAGPMRAWSRTTDTSALLSRAYAQQMVAQGLQQAAALANIDAVEARVAQRRDSTPQTIARAQQATAREDEAYRAAQEAWAKVASQLDETLASMGESDSIAAKNIRWLRDRATIGSGGISSGVNSLEEMLGELKSDSQDTLLLRLRVREELASAYYYGARLMRLSGRPEEEWRLVSDRARQNARVLAESAEPAMKHITAGPDYQKNLEVMLDFELRSLQELQDAPAPANSPSLYGGKTKLDGWPWNQQGKGRTEGLPNDSRGAGSKEAVQGGGS